MANSKPTGSSTLSFSTPFLKNNSYPITGKQLLQGFSDVDLKNGDVLKVSFPESEHGTLTPTQNGDWSFTPAKDFVGKVTFDYFVSDKKMQYMEAKVSFEVISDSVASKTTADIFKANGYYSTFADLAKAAYHLAPEEQLHSVTSKESKYLPQTQQPAGYPIHGQGENFIKPYAELAWGKVVKDWSVLKNTDLNMDSSGVIDVIVDDTWYLESDGVYHSENAAAFAARSGDAVVISFRGTNDNDNGVVQQSSDEANWIDMAGHYSELLFFTKFVDNYVKSNNIKNVYVTGHSLGGGMALSYMDQHPAGTNKTDNGSTINYEAVTFAAPAYKAVGLTLDERVISIKMDGDVVPNTGGYHQGRIVKVNSPLIHEDTKKPYGTIVSSDYHSMDIYMEAAHSLDSQLPNTTTTVTGKSVHGFNLNSFDVTYQAQVILPMLETKGTADGYTWDGKISPKFVAMTGDNFLDGTGKSYYSGDKNVMIGGVGNDTYDVDNNQDLIIEKANAGTDLINSFVSFTLPANVENLTLKSTMGADYDDFTATGNELNNVLDDNEGDNVLSGLTGNDTLIGGVGKDTLIGGLGKDIVSGGKGADVFKFNSIAESGSTVKTNDVIMDFNHDQGDKIDLKSIDANTKLAKDQEFTFVGSVLLFDIAVANGTKFTNSLYFNEVTQILYGDVNSDNKPDFSIQLSGVSSLETSDFIL